MDINGVRDWAKSIVESDNPSARFVEQGSRFPRKYWRLPRAQERRASLMRFTNGEWLIYVDFDMGMEISGLAFGRDNARFPDGYFVYTHGPGLYYYQAHCSTLADMMHRTSSILRFIAVTFLIFAGANLPFVI